MAAPRRPAAKRGKALVLHVRSCQPCMRARTDMSFLACFLPSAQICTNGTFPIAAHLQLQAKNKRGREFFSH